MECFIIYFRKDGACRYQRAVLLDTKNFPTAPKANRCDFANWTTANPTMSLLRSATPSRAVTSQESLGRRIVHRSCPARSQKAAVPLHCCFPNPVVRQETEIFVSLPFIDLPDPEGFYASLVLRKVRAELHSRWELSGCDGSSPKWNALDQPSAAQTLREVARCGTAGEPLETLLAEMARRYVQTSVLERRPS
jgi:hypothetical protein